MPSPHCCCCRYIFLQKCLGKTKVLPILPMTVVLPAPLTTVGYPMQDTIMGMQPKTCPSLGKLPSTPQISDKKRDEWWRNETLYVASFFVPLPLSFRVKNVQGRAQDKEWAFCCGLHGQCPFECNVARWFVGGVLLYFMDSQVVSRVEGQSQLLSFICISFNGGTQVFKAIDEEDCSETMRDGVTLLPK